MLHTGIEMDQQEKEKGMIDQITLDAWTAPYRGWHYYAEAIVPSNPIGSNRWDGLVQRSVDLATV
jgi:hypothetical protein